MKRLMIALAAVMAASCATAVDPDQFAAADDQICMGWGHFVGTPDYARCRTALTEQRNQQMAAQRQEWAARLAAAGQAMQAASRSQSYPTAQQSAPAARPLPTQVCFKKGEQVSGFNKICVYDCLGSAHAETIGSVELCPLSVSR